MTSTETDTTLLAQLRTLLDLTHTEIQVAETRVVQARTEAVQRELSQNADNGHLRAEAIEKAIGRSRGPEPGYHNGAELVVSKSTSAQNS